MFPQFKKLNNESGIVLFIVLMTAILIMLFSLGILTQSMNEINYAQQQIDQIASDQLVKGVWWNAYNAESNSMTLPTGQSVSLSGRSYGTGMTIVSPSAISNYQVSVSYDSF